MYYENILYLLYYVKPKTCSKIIFLSFTTALGGLYLNTKVLYNSIIFYELTSTF